MWDHTDERFHSFVRGVQWDDQQNTPPHQRIWTAVRSNTTLKNKTWWSTGRTKWCCLFIGCCSLPVDLSHGFCTQLSSVFPPCKRISDHKCWIFTISNRGRPGSIIEIKINKKNHSQHNRCGKTTSVDFQVKTKQQTLPALFNTGN